MRSIFPERWNVLEVEAALELGRRALRAERDLEPARDERQLGLGLGADERLQVAPERPARSSLRWRSVSSSRDSAPPAIASVRHSRRNSSASSSCSAGTCSAPSRFGSPEKNLKSAWWAIDPRMRASTSASIDLGSSMPLDEPDRRAARERLELGDAEHRARAQRLEHGRVGQPGRPAERAERAVEPPLPAVRAARSRSPPARRWSRATRRARSRSRSLGAPSIGQTSSESARRRVTRGRSSRPQHAPGRPPRTGSAGAARRRRSPPRARGRAGATAACTRCRRGSGRARPGRASRAVRASVELAAAVVVEERRALRALREDALLQAEDEHDLRAARARAQEVDDRDVARRAGPEPDRRTLERGDQLLGRELAAELHPALELVQQREHRLVGPQVEPGASGARAERRARRRRAASRRRARARRRSKSEPSAGARVAQGAAREARRSSPPAAPASGSRGRAAVLRGSRRGRARARSTGERTNANRSRRPPPSHA